MNLKPSQRIMIIGVITRLSILETLRRNYMDNHNRVFDRSHIQKVNFKSKLKINKHNKLPNNLKKQ